MLQYILLCFVDVLPFSFVRIIVTWVDLFARYRLNFVRRCLHFLIRSRVFSPSLKRMIVFFFFSRRFGCLLRRNFFNKKHCFKTNRVVSCPGQPERPNFYCGRVWWLEFVVLRNSNKLICPTSAAVFHMGCRQVYPQRLFCSASHAWCMNKCRVVAGASS